MPGGMNPLVVPTPLKLNGRLGVLAYLDSENQDSAMLHGVDLP